MTTVGQLPQLHAPPVLYDGHHGSRGGDKSSLKARSALLPKRERLRRGRARDKARVESLRAQLAAVSGADQVRHDEGITDSSDEPSSDDAANLRAAHERIHALEKQVACLHAIIDRLTTDATTVAPSGEAVASPAAEMFNIYEDEAKADAGSQTDISVYHWQPDVFVSAAALPAAGDAAAGIPQWVAEDFNSPGVSAHSADVGSSLVLQHPGHHLTEGDGGGTSKTTLPAACASLAHEEEAHIASSQLDSCQQDGGGIGRTEEGTPITTPGNAGHNKADEPPASADSLSCLLKGPVSVATPFSFNEVNGKVSSYCEGCDDNQTAHDEHIGTEAVASGAFGILRAIPAACAVDPDGEALVSPTPGKHTLACRRSGEGHATQVVNAVAQEGEGTSRTTPRRCNASTDTLASRRGGEGHATKVVNAVAQGLADVQSQDLASQCGPLPIHPVATGAYPGGEALVSPTPGNTLASICSGDGHATKVVNAVGGEGTSITTPGNSMATNTLASGDSGDGHTTPVVNAVARVLVDGNSQDLATQCGLLPSPSVAACDCPGGEALVSPTIGCTGEGTSKTTPGICKSTDTLASQVSGDEHATPVVNAVAQVSASSQDLATQCGPLPVLLIAARDQPAPGYVHEQSPLAAAGGSQQAIGDSTAALQARIEQLSLEHAQQQVQQPSQHELKILYEKQQRELKAQRRRKDKGKGKGARS